MALQQVDHELMWVDINMLLDDVKIINVNVTMIFIIIIITEMYVMSSNVDLISLLQAINV